MDFGAALNALKAGARISRAGWNGKGMWVELQRPDAHSKMSLPYVFMRTATGELVPWVASQSDVLADDWSVIHTECAVEAAMYSTRAAALKDASAAAVFPLDAAVPALKAGDVVQLKCGGPLMTVEDVGEDSVRCVWFQLFGVDSRGEKVWANEPARAKYPLDTIRRFDVGSV